MNDKEFMLIIHYKNGKGTIIGDDGSLEQIDFDTCDKSLLKTIYNVIVNVSNSIKSKLKGRK
jgi:hypothetical protein